MWQNIFESVKGVVDQGIHEISKVDLGQISQTHLQAGQAFLGDAHNAIGQGIGELAKVDFQQLSTAQGQAAKALFDAAKDAAEHGVNAVKGVVDQGIAELEKVNWGEVAATNMQTSQVLLEIAKGIVEQGVHELSKANLGEFALSQLQVGQALIDGAKHTVGQGINELSEIGHGGIGKEQLQAVNALLNECIVLLAHCSNKIAAIPWEQILKDVVDFVAEHPWATALQAAIVITILFPELVTMPVLLAYGFSATGPAAGSLAALTQSLVGTPPLFSLAQSAAMGGTGNLVLDGIVQGGALAAGGALQAVIWAEMRKANAASGA